MERNYSKTFNKDNRVYETILCFERFKGDTPEWNHNYETQCFWTIIDFAICGPFCLMPPNKQKTRK